MEPRSLSTTNPTIAEQSFLLALRAWGGIDPAEAFRRTDPGSVDRLREAWELADDLGHGPETARNRLKEGHHAALRVSLRRVHPTWLVRALQQESPAVQRRVLRELAPNLARIVGRRLGVRPDDLRDDHAPDLNAIDWVATLWTERLVGDVEARDDDPLVLLAMTRLAPSRFLRLIHTVGLVKRAYAREDVQPVVERLDLALLTRGARARLAAIRETVGSPDAKLVKVARGDVGSFLEDPTARDLRRFHEDLGSVTVGRLLSKVDPARVRWGLQHLPYPAVRPIRSRIPTNLHSKSLLAWEARVFRLASERLIREGVLPDYAGGGHA